MCLLSPLAASAAPRDHLLRWIVPPEPDVASYSVYLALASMAYGGGTNIGFQSPDSNGVASYLLTGLDSDTRYYVVMTASDTSGNESVFSNEIMIPPLICMPADCDDGNTCTTNVCSGSCINDPLPDGTLCDDGNPGTVGDACTLGVCQGVLPECTVNGQCDDGNACNGVETCQASQCVAGVPPTCSPATQCMSSSCDPVAGCQLTLLPDGTSCDDANPTTFIDVCTGGVCLGGPPECTVHSQCNDGDACNGVETCQAFQCVAGAPPTCSPSTQCVNSFCNPASGCQSTLVPDATPCDDGDPSSFDDACVAGICLGNECGEDFDCDDGNMCTLNTCNGGSSCVTTPVLDGMACYDQIPATIGDLCETGVCVEMCGVDTTCPLGAGRDYLLSWPVPIDPDLAGYVLYLSFEPLAGSEGLDIGFLLPDASDMVSFLLAGLNARIDYYAEIGAYNDAGDEWLAMAEILIAALPCDTAGCDDGDPCTADGCAGDNCTNDVVPDGTPCDDGEAGTIDDICLSGVCGGIVPECTLDAQCGDGDACNGTETCDNFACAGGTPLSCPLATQCMDSFCDPILGCRFEPAPNGTGCDDGNAITVNDVCFQGACQGIIPECTLDVQCDDGNACNGVETCQAFTCVSGSAPVCAPSSQCTVSSCNPAIGCQVVPVADGTTCDDGDHFTGDDVCSVGVCSGTVLECEQVECEDGDFWCQLQVVLLRIVGEIDSGQSRPCN